MVIAVGNEQPSLTVEDLEAAGLDEQFDAIESAVERHLGGDVTNIAVISEPFAGRDIFLDYAEQEFGAAARRTSIDQLVTDELPEVPNAEIVLVDYIVRLGLLGHNSSSGLLQLTSFERHSFAVAVVSTELL